MSSNFKLNQLSAQQEIHSLLEEPNTALENRDREIYALRQQLQTLKILYKNSKAKTEVFQPKNSDESSIENDYTKQRIEKLMAILAEREKQIRAIHAETRQQHSLVLDEWQKEREAKQAALNEIAALQGQLEFLKTKFSNSQRTLKVQQEQIKELQEKQTLTSAQLQSVGVINHEKEILRIEHEKQKNQIRDLTDLQHLLEEQFFQGKRKQEQLHESVKEAKSSACTWENKYFDMYAKFEELAKQLKEFKHLEEKLFQMKSLWMSFGQFFGEKTLSSSQEAEAKSMTSYLTSLKDPKAILSSELCDIRQSQVPHLEILQANIRTPHHALD